MAAQRMKNLSGGSCPLLCGGGPRPHQWIPHGRFPVWVPLSQTSYLSPFSRCRHAKVQLVEPAPVRPLPAGDLDPPTGSVTLAAPNLHTKFHLDRYSRFVTMHVHHRHTDRRLSSAATLCCATQKQISRRLRRRISCSAAAAAEKKTFG